MTDETTKALSLEAEQDGDTYTIRFPDGHVITARANGRLAVTNAASGFAPFDLDVARLAHSLPSQADATSGEEMRLRTINHEIRDDLIAAAPETVAFEDLIAWLSTVHHFSWTWTANTRCKYVDIRIDTRRGAFAILDRDGNKITLDELRHQHRAALTKGADRHD